MFVIDDDPDIIETLEEFLTREGYSPCSSTDPVSGLEELRGQTYEALLLDMRMPEMSGLEVLNELRKFDNHISVVMMTAYPAVESAIEAKRRGVIDYLRKPFELGDLRRILERIERSKRRR